MQKLINTLRPFGLALALGTGVGVGQGLVQGAGSWPVGLPFARAQQSAAVAEAPLNSEEQSIIRVARQVSPAVVTVSRNGGMGSGVLIRSDGVLLTNAHVVGDATQVRVELADGRRLSGRVLGRDPGNDVAVIRIPGSGFPAAASRRLRWATRIACRWGRPASPSATRWGSTAA